MVKQKVMEETKAERFKRIATARTLRILENLRLLGNCSTLSTYEYTEDEIVRIFSTIEKETKRIKAMFNKSSNINFSLERD